MDYLLFAYTDYYPKGGWNDFVGVYNSECDAIARYELGFVPEWADGDEEERVSYDSGQIVNATSLRVVKEW